MTYGGTEGSPDSDPRFGVFRNLGEGFLARDPPSRLLGEVVYLELLLVLLVTFF